MVAGVLSEISEAEVLPSPWGIVAAAVATGLYSLGRGQAKRFAPLLFAPLLFAALLILPAAGCAMPAQVANARLQAVNAVEFEDRLEAETYPPSPAVWDAVLRWVGDQRRLLVSQYLSLAPAGTPAPGSTPASGISNLESEGVTR